MHINSYKNCIETVVDATKKSQQAVLGLPFDIARENYASAVKMGFIEKSMIASAKFAKSLYKMESLTLGPLARSL